jgi:hypothetical protein
LLTPSVALPYSVSEVPKTAVTKAERTAALPLKYVEEPGGPNTSGVPRGCANMDAVEAALRLPGPSCQHMLCPGDEAEIPHTSPSVEDIELKGPL